jgi:RNA polymerase sigma-70 factor, ECF subfamily
VVGTSNWAVDARHWLADRAKRPSDDHDVVLRVARGDRAAFRELVERYQAPLYSFVLRMVRRPAVAEELVQETFVRAYRAAPRYRPDAAVITWLFNIAARLAMNEAARAHHRRELAIEPPDVPAGAPDPQEALERKELSAAVEHALAQLPPAQRAAVVLARFEGMSYREIGQVLEVSEGAVDGLLQRARQALARLLRPFA